MLPPKGNSLFRNFQVNRDNFKTCFKKIPNLGILLPNPGQDFHPGDPANEHARVTGIFLVGLPQPV